MLRRAFASKAAAVALIAGLAFGVAESAPAQSAGSGGKDERLTTTWSLAANPHIVINREVTGALALGLGLLTGGFVVQGMRNGQKGAASLRAFASGVLALSLYNPELVREHHEKLPTEVAIVVDKSASQSLGSRAQETAAAYSHLAEQLSQIEGVRISTTEVGDSKSGQADGTRIFSSMRNASATPDTVFVLTDGQVHDVPAKADAAGKNPPLHALVSGHNQEKDRVIVIDQAPGFGFLNQNQTIKFHVSDEGSVSEKNAKLRVAVNIDGKTVTTKTVTAGKPASVNIGLRHAGANVIELQADPLDQELTTVNNRAVASVQGIRENLKVLLISGAPSQSIRAWRNLLKSDPDTKLVHFMITRPLEKLDDTPPDELSLSPFPLDEVFSENIKKFDLVIFDHYEDKDVLPSEYLENIAGYVKGGGALLVVSGPEYAGRNSLYGTALGGVLPVLPTGRVSEVPYVPQATERGIRHPVVRDLGGNAAKGDMPSWGRWFRLTDSKVKSGEVVMQGADKSPLLVLDRKRNKGRVAMLMSDHVWLWERGIEGGGPYADLLMRIPHWLLQDSDLEEEALRLNAQGANLTVEQQTMAGKASPVTITMPSGKSEDILLEAAGPGLWKRTIDASLLEGAGLYVAERKGKDSAKAFASVGLANPREWRELLSSDEGLLKDYAESTGGSIMRMKADDGAPIVLPRIVPVYSDDPAAEMAGPGWMGIRMNSAIVVKGVDRMPLPPPLLALCLVMASLAGAYRLESGKSLLGTKNKPEKKDDAAPGI